jgi:hypothetical protein
VSADSSARRRPPRLGQRRRFKRGAGTRVISWQARGPALHPWSHGHPGVGADSLGMRGKLDPGREPRCTHVPRQSPTCSHRSPPSLRSIELLGADRGWGAWRGWCRLLLRRRHRPGRSAAALASRQAGAEALIAGAMTRDATGRSWMGSVRELVLSGDRGSWVGGTDGLRDGLVSRQR